jgi:molecular chaperone HscC
MAIVGIDLGTTNSLVAIYDDVETKIIENRFGENLTPSVVSLLETGDIVVGKAARERLIVAPSETFSSFKRNMGTTKQYVSEIMTLTPMELSAMVLRSLCEDATQVLGETIEKVVISVPAYFTDLQRKSTMEAARVAGLLVIGIVNEPTAAALAYHLHESDRERLIAVVDLGGGTYDISILDIYDSVIEVKAVAGDNYLGGDDFDMAIVAFICDKYGLKLEILSQKDVNKLKYIAEQFKIGFDTLDQQHYEIALSNMKLYIELDKDEFEEACFPIIARLKEPVRKAFMDAEIDFMDVEEVILVGGSTKMPIVKQQITRLFGRVPLCYLNPDEVVAQGAAIYAALREKNVSLADMVMTDVCPYTLGTETMVRGKDGNYVKRFDPIIERNMTVPISKMQQYVAIDDDQKELRIKIYQGENPNPDENVYLGEIVHEIASGSEIDSMTTVQFTYDRNGILEVITTNLKNKEEKRAIMLNSNALSEEDIEKCLTRISKIKNHPYKEAANLFMMAKAEKLYDMVSGQDKERVKEAIGLYRDALLSQNTLRIRKAKENLMMVFGQFEESL